MSDSAPRPIPMGEILAALEDRFDHESAATMFHAALAHAGLVPAATYTPEQVCRVAWAVSELERRAQPAVSALMALATKGATGGAPGDPDEPYPEEVSEPVADDAVVPLEMLGAMLPQVVAAAMESVRVKRAAKREERSGEGEDEPEEGSLAH
jgi:hypothetical protein